ncbi:MAG: hypothetical protein AAB903_00730 [Patescibacteria group bacterium]
METALLVGQILFYFTVSLAIIVGGILFSIVTYYLIRTAKNLEALSKNLNAASEEAIERINEAIDRLSDLPVLSYFLRKRSGEEGRKGSRKNKSK